jgi:anti-sigma regulatory factor (Ser/Thr protein kinase)
MEDRPNSSEPIALEFRARPEYLAEVRRAVERLGLESGLSSTKLDEFLTAVDEAVANAVRHGSPDGARNVVRVKCLRLPAGLVVEVQDQGKGFPVPTAPKMPAPDAPGGRGLPLMCALADSVKIASNRKGTTVTLKKMA